MNSIITRAMSDIRRERRHDKLSVIFGVLFILAAIALAYQIGVFIGLASIYVVGH